MMNLKNTNILLMGAAGGIGRHLAASLLERGANLGLNGFSEDELNTLREFLSDAPQNFFTVAADITNPEGRQKCLDELLDHYASIDILINLAGINAFTTFESQSPENIEKIINVNTLAPMLMTHAVLPHMLAQKKGQIVNVGSTFGSIGFPCFTAYSTSKFALRGFSQSLRRELADSGVQVTYVAPRAVNTPLNSPAVYEMAKEIKMNFDEPEFVAHEIVKAIESGKQEKYIGFPESLFARINGILPGMVDNSLKKQIPAMRRYAQKDAD
jgi:short-subunit dehydrogenase